MDCASVHTIMGDQLNVKLRESLKIIIHLLRYFEIKHTLSVGSLLLAYTGGRVYNMHIDPDEVVGDDGFGRDAGGGVVWRGNLAN